MIPVPEPFVESALVIVTPVKSNDVKLGLTSTRACRC